MFGFSLGKLIVLALVVAAVWYGFKAYARMQRIDEGGRKPGERTMADRLRRAAQSKSAPEPEPIEDTEKCPTCGVYVAIDTAKNCGKPDCPY